MSSALESLAATGRPAILIGTDKTVLDGLANAFNPDKKGIPITFFTESVEVASKSSELNGALVIIIDLGAAKRESLVALQGMMNRISLETPVIVLVDTFDDALARWLLQIKVADFLRKPADPKEVVKACVRALRSSSDLPDAQSQIIAFIPAAGGVGATSLSIEAAMILLRHGGSEPDSACLVDLDFDSGACADYLDLEPRLTLAEMGKEGERLDSQLLEVMTSRHATGLTLFAARGDPTMRHNPDPIVVARLLDLISTRFDHVIIDMPRWWEPWTDDVLRGANRVLVITDATVPGLRLGRRMATGIHKKMPEISPRVVVNRFEQTMFGAGLRKTDIEKVLEGRLSGVVSNNYRLVREAIDRGCPLETIKQGNPVTLDLKKILINTEGA
jgi:pilus assembly protein CpaE